MSVDLKWAKVTYEGKTKRIANPQCILSQFEKQLQKYF